MMSLYRSKKDCCGCMACMNICPKKAITMECDENGYLLPKVSEDLCVECGKCRGVCAFQNADNSKKMPLATYAAVNKSSVVLSSSASGGVFGAVAKIILEKQGVLFGSAYDEDMIPRHMCVDDISDLTKLQGSKYVQSDINSTYAETKRFLKEERWVLFTGTPCQIAGLKAYLDKDYPRLIAVDIICHGVASEALFKGYLKYLEEKLNGRITDFKFRDKSRGWGLMGRVTYTKKGISYNKLIKPVNSYYYNYFLNGDIYRDSCYECKYACGSREGDITMGDYWGVEQFHPEIDSTNGVSVLLVNSDKGLALLKELAALLELIDSNFENARTQNAQLNEPTEKSARREAILRTWNSGGYKALARSYFIQNHRQILLSALKSFIPRQAKIYLMKVAKSGNHAK